MFIIMEKYLYFLYYIIIYLKKDEVINNFLKIISKNIMKYSVDYYYLKYEKNNNLTQYQKNKTNVWFNKNIYAEIINQEDRIYLIFYQNKLVGFFSFNLCDEKIVKIGSIFIEKEYRLKGLGRDLLNDITYLARSHKNNYKYIIANSFVESVLFFFKNGYEFCRKNDKIENTEKTVLVMFKKI